MHPPLIVVDGGDVLFFKNKNALESYLEPIDIRNGTYEAYDAAGKSLHLSVTSREPPRPFPRWFRAIEHVTVSETGEDRTDELAFTLKRILEKTETGRGGAALPSNLPTLLEAAISVFGFAAN